MSIGGNTIGIKGIHNIKHKYVTEVIDGHSVKSVNKSWHTTNVGWNIWVDGKKYFRNHLTRQEAINSVMSYINKQY